MAFHIAQNLIQEIRNASDIVEIISESVFLKPAGHNFSGLCPFHNDKTPSFTVSPLKQIYYCFGCGVGGDVFSFLIKHENLSFPDAVSTLAKRHGIKIPKNIIPKKEQINLIKRETIASMNYDAMIFYHQTLINLEEKHPVSTYLRNRAVSQTTICEFKIGYAPAKWHSIKEYLGKKDWKESLIASSGLIVINKSTKTSYDRFRHRIVFPIFDSKNCVIGFGGRVIDKALPKYMNSPETVLYNKSNSLYGIHIAKKECRKTKMIFVVEGYFDLISLHKSGIKNSVATLGTSITSRHVRHFKACIGPEGKIVLVYDSDQAGLNAAHRSLYTFQKEAVDVKIMVLPIGYDPDSFIGEFGPKVFIAESKKAMDTVSFMIHLGINQNGLDTSGKMKTINGIIQFIASDNSSLHRTLSIQELAKHTDIDESVLQQEVNTQIGGKSSKISDKYTINRNLGNVAQSKKNEPYNRTYRLEVQILTMMLQYPYIIDTIQHRHIIEHFKNKTLKTIANYTFVAPKDNISHLNNILESCSNEKEKSITARLALTQEKWNKDGCMLLIKQFENIIMKENNCLLKKINHAEETGDIKLLGKLLKEKQEFAKTINRNVISKKLSTL